jgi:hypothetical protein
MAHMSRLGAARKGRVKNRIAMDAGTGHRSCRVGPTGIEFEKNATSWSKA